MKRGVARKNVRGHIIQTSPSLPRLVVFLFALAGSVAALSLGILFLPPLLESWFGDSRADQNRTWLTSVWAENPRPDSDIQVLADLLQDNGIAGVYWAALRWEEEKASFVELPYSADFQRRFRPVAPQIEMWLWLVIDTPQLFDAPSRQGAVALAGRLVRIYGLVGVHVQARAVPDNSEDFITLLRELDAELGPAQISVAVSPDRTPLDPAIPSSPGVAQNLTWSVEYKRRVLLNSDEIVLMGHASGLNQQSDYEKWLAYQVGLYAQALAELGLNSSYYVALPTYPAELGHDPLIENVDSALNAIENARAREPAVGRLLTGVGLYPWEETDLFELDTYWNRWVLGN